MRDQTDVKLLLQEIKKGFEGLGITVISPKDFLKESLLFVSEKQHNQ